MRRCSSVSRGPDLALLDERVGEIGETEDRHAIEIAVEAIDVRILVPAALDEHLHRERLPGRVCGKPALVLWLAPWRARRQGSRRPCSMTDVVHLVLERLRHLEHVQHVTGQIRRHRQAFTRPVGEAAAGTLVPLELRDLRLRDRLEVFRIDVGQRERLAEIRRQQQRQGTRRSLLGAAVRILDDIACAFAEADHGRRGELHVKSAEAGNDA